MGYIKKKFQKKGGSTLYAFQLLDKILAKGATFNPYTILSMVKVGVSAIKADLSFFLFSFLFFEYILFFKVNRGFFWQV